MKRIWLTIFLMFATLGMALGQQTTTTGTFVDPDGTAWNAGTYSIQYVNAIPGKPYNTSTGAFITTLYSGSLNSSGALSLTLDDVKYVSPANGTWAFTICPNVSGGASNCSTVDIPVTGASENVSSLVNAALRAPRPGGGVGAYGYADVEFQSIPGNTYVVSPALTVQRCYAGSWAACGSGGGGGTPATPVQSPQINQQGSFGSQQNVYVAWSGDTLTSLASVCASNPSTIEVSTGLTLVPTVATALPSDCNVSFLGNGEFVNNTAYKITINGKVNSDAPVQRFGGTGTFSLGIVNSLVPVEWFGAAVGGSASTNLTAIQAAANSLTSGQVKFSGMYSIAGTVAFPNGIGAQGIPAFRGGVPSSYLSGLTETVAGDDAIDQHGTSGATITGGKFQDFAVLSSVAQTGTAAGISCSFAGGTIANNLFVQDFIYDVYAHACPSYGGPGWNGIATQHDSLIASGSVYGFFLDSGDGYPESSITIRNSGYNDASNGSHTSTAMLIQGTAINDVNVFNFNVAKVSGWGVHINSTAFGTLAASDLHFVSLTVDGSTAGAVPVELDGVAGGNVGGTITFTDARLSTTHNPAEMFYILQSQNIQLLGSQLDGGQIGVNLYAAGATGNVIANNVILDNSSEAINDNAPQNVISGNSIGGTTTTGLLFPSGTSNNTYGLNTCASSVTTCVSDGGTGNGLQAPININGIATGSFNILSLFAPNSANATTVSMLFGHDQSANNMNYLQWHYASTGSASNHFGWTMYGESGDNFDVWPNLSMTFGETTPAAGPANGLAVGTTGQFQVSGAGAVTAPSIASKIINGVSIATLYSGASPAEQITACLADAAAQTNGNTSGKCDASGFGGAQALDNGFTVPAYATLLLPAKFVWTLGTASTQGIVLTNNGAILGPCTPYTATCEILDNANYIPSIFSTTGSGYYRAEGFALANYGYVVSSGYEAVISGAGDGSVFRNISIANYVAATAGLEVTDSCCGAYVDGLVIDNGYTGTIDLDLEASSGNVLQGFNFHNVSLGHPVSGSPALKCNDTSSNGLSSSILMDGLYVELNSTDQATTPVQVTGCGSIQMSAVTVNDISGAGTGTGISVSTAANTALNIDSMTMDNYTQPANAVLNSNTSVTTPTDAYGHLSSYSANPFLGTATANSVFANKAWTETTPCFGVQIGLDSSNSNPGVRLCDSTSTIANDLRIVNSGGTYNLYNTSARIFYVDNSGNVTGLSGATLSGFGSMGTGTMQLQALDQASANNTGGKCTMSGTSCTLSIAHTYTTPVCIATQQSTTLTGTYAGCTVSGTTVTITAAVTNTETWGALVFGDPN